MLSVEEVPTSDAAARSGTLGATGAVRSMVIMVEAVDKLAGPVLPAMSLMAAIARRG